MARGRASRRLDTIDALEDGFYTFLQYARVNSKELGNICLGDHLYRAQKRFFTAVFDGLRRDIHDIKHLKSRQLGICLHPDTRVLTADLRWVRIADLEVGQEIVAVDEYPPGGRGADRKMRTAVVQHVFKVFGPAYRIRFDDGRSVVCTGQHRWLSKKSEPHTEWRSTHPWRWPKSKLGVGSHVRWITKPWVPGSVEDGWFGGMLDGEGSLSNKNRSGASVNVSQRPSPVWDRLVRYAEVRGYTACVESDAKPRRSKFGRVPVPKLCFNRMDEIFRLIGQTRPTRFISKAWWEGRSLPGKRSGVGWAKIVSVESIGNEAMIDLQTSTGTYIAEGFVSHNSTGSRALTIYWAGMHDGLRGYMVFDTDGHKEEARLELLNMIRSIPRRQKFPGVKRENRYLIELENESAVQFAAAGVKSSKSSGVLGRSSGVNLAHCSEICSWDNPEGQEAFRNSLAKDFLNRLYLWESTARGYNQWHKLCQDAKIDPEHQIFLFTGWWAKDNQVILRSEPDFERYGLQPPTDIELHKMAEVQHLYGWEITPEQLAWYRRHVDPAAKPSGDAPAEWEGTAAQIQEQPWTEEEAWQMPGAVFFPPETLAEIAGRTCTNKYKTYMYSTGIEFVDCRVMPAPNARSVELKVWEEPVEGSVYVVAGDPAYGTSEENDRSGAQVLRCYADGLDQVAEYAWPLVNTKQFAWVLASLLGWYAGETSEVYFILELNGPGQAVWDEIQSLRSHVSSGYQPREIAERGLQNIFRNVRNYIYTRPDAMSVGRNYQWKTTGPLKVRIMERLRDFVSNRMLVVRSIETVEEMHSIARSGDSIKAPGHQHDDRVIALALGVRNWEERARKMLVGQKRTREAEQRRQTLTMRDQVFLFNQNQFTAFFAQKSAQRSRERLALARAHWRRR